MMMGMPTAMPKKIHARGKPSRGAKGMDSVTVVSKMNSRQTFMAPISTATGVRNSGSAMRRSSRPDAAVPVQ